MTNLILAVDCMEQEIAALRARVAELERKVATLREIPSSTIPCDADEFFQMKFEVYSKDEDQVGG